MPAPRHRDDEFPQPDKVVIVLTVTDSPETLSDLTRILERSNWRIRSARSCQEALGFLKAHPLPVIVCERKLPDGNWADLYTCLDSLSEPPTLIVTSPHADQGLWAEVLNLGGYDVLPQPFERAEVVRVVSLAWLRWKERHMRLQSRLHPEQELTAAV